MHVEAHHTLAELQAMLQAEPSKRRYLRIRAVLLALSGELTLDIAETLGCSRRAVQSWVYRYNAEGTDAFSDRPRPGRPRYLSPEQEQELLRRLDEPPRPEDGVCTLRGKEIQAIVEREFGVVYTLQGIYDLLHRLGYSCLEPRPRHRQADPEAQAAFKKNWRPIFGVSNAAIPTAVSRSGSRTRLALARKAR